MESKTSILLADDHSILRSGLCLLINAQSNMVVVGEAQDGAQTLAEAERLQPDLILLDLSMPGLGGLQALPLLRQRCPDSRVLILTMHDDDGYLREVLRAGASGYVLKKAVDSELLNAIRAVMRGETYVHPAMTRALLDSTFLEQQTRSDENPWHLLSEREFDVLRLVALGHTNAEIAERLSLSVKTVETYRGRGMEKMRLDSRAQLVRSALTYGILD